VNQQNAKAGVKGALVVGTTVLLPVTAVGLAGSGAIVGGGSSAADQAIDGKPVDMVTVAIDTVVGAATGLATYGVVKIAGALGTAAVFEEKNCWLFLKNKSLVYRENCEQWTDAAIVISKKGKVMVVADHHEDEAALKGYLEKISIYLETRGE
jgi:hypothetical protein